MVNEILDGLIGGLIASVITLGGVIITNRYNYKDMYSRVVSKSRMSWINCFREEVGIIIACLEMPKWQRDEKKFEARKARVMLLTRLNMDTSKAGNGYNRAFAKLLNKIDFDTMPCNKEIIEQLISMMRAILEPEWQRVKKEAKG